MGTNQNNFPDWRGDSHDLESLFDWSKDFQDWLEMGIYQKILASKFFRLVLKGFLSRLVEFWPLEVYWSQIEVCKIEYS